jgi:hypothetical protein
MNRDLSKGRVLTRLLPPALVAGVLSLAGLLAQRPSVIYLVLIGGALGLVFLLLHPGLGLVALAALSFTVPVHLGTGTEVALTLPVFLIPVVAAAWLLAGLCRGQLWVPRSRPVLPLVLFVLVGLVSLLAGRATWDPLVPQPGNLLLVQLGQWGIYALSAVIFLLAGVLGQRGRWLEVATWTFLAVGTVVVAEFYCPPLRRLLGWSLLANRSLFWTWLAALAAGQLLAHRQLRPLARGWLLALLAAAAYVVWFRLNDWVSGWAPFFAAVATVVWLRVWRRNRAGAVILAAVAALLAALLFPLVFTHAGGQAELQVSWGGRWLLYRAVLDLVKEHPVLGLGPAAYRQYGLTRWLAAGAGGARWIRPSISSHNNYLDIYAQMGLVGLGLFLWFLFEVGRLGWRLSVGYATGDRPAGGGFRAGYVYGALGGLAGTLLAMMLADWFLPFVYNIGFAGFRTSALAWMFLGGLVALDQGHRKGKEEGTG